MAVSKSQQKAVNKYRKTNYDLVQLTMPKGNKAAIKAHAAACGESVNGFVNRAIGEAIERDATEMPVKAPRKPVAAFSGDGSIVSCPEDKNALQGLSVGAEGMLTLTLPAETVKAATEHAEKTGEEIAQFIARAVEKQTERDAVTAKLGLSPVTGERLKPTAKEERPGATPGSESE